MTDQAANILTVRGLQAGYGPIRVLTDVNLDVGPGQIVGLAGLNGVGKTTTLRAVSGVIGRTAGSVTLDGTALESQPHSVARRGLAHVPERRHLFATLTVEENLRYGSVAAKGRRLTERRADVLDAFPRLVELLMRRAGYLSGGEQQMLAVARGLMSGPRLLMVDELSLGLSPKAAKDISQALVRFARRESLALFLVDQNITLLRSTCDHLYLLRDGATRTLPISTDSTELEAAYF